MQKVFKIETILTVVTGINLTDNFSDVYELAYFIYNDPYISPLGIELLRNDMKEYLLSLYPELNNINYVPITENARKIWVLELKIEFGDTLKVRQIHNETNTYKLSK